MVLFSSPAPPLANVDKAAMGNDQISRGEFQNPIANPSRENQSLVRAYEAALATVDEMTLGLKTYGAIMGICL
jgi:hypothetical protein